MDSKMETNPEDLKKDEDDNDSRMINVGGGSAPTHSYCFPPLPPHPEPKVTTRTTPNSVLLKEFLNRAERKRSKRSHYVTAMAYESDRNAMTSDPEVMKRNYKIPLNLVTFKNKIIRLKRLDKNGVFIVSPEFAASYCDGLYYNHFKNNSLPPDECRKRQKIKYRHMGNAPCNMTRFNQQGISPYVPIKPRVKEVTQNSENHGNVQITINEFPPPYIPLNLKTKEESNSQNAPNQQQFNQKNPVEDGIPSEDDQTTTPKCLNQSNLRVAEFKEVDVVVTLGSIRRLAPDRKLDDDLLDFGVYFYLQHLPSVVYVRAFAWTSYVFKNDVNEAQKRSLFRIVTKRETDSNLLRKQYIVFPVIKEDHWTLAIICNPFPSQSDVERANEMSSCYTPEIVSKWLYNRWTNNRTPPMVFILDSKYAVYKRYCNFHENHSKTAKYAILALKNIHQKYWDHLGSKLIVNENVFKFRDDELCESIRFHSLQVPPQPTGFDCGVYCIQFAKHWFKEMIATNHNYMSMIQRDCTNWFDPKTLVKIRKAIYIKILQICKNQHPQAYNLVLNADPLSKIQ